MKITRVAHLTLTLTEVQLKELIAAAGDDEGELCSFETYDMLTNAAEAAGIAYED